MKTVEHSEGLLRIHRSDSGLASETALDPKEAREATSPILAFDAVEAMSRRDGSGNPKVVTGGDLDKRGDCNGSQKDKEGFSFTSKNASGDKKGFSFSGKGVSGDKEGFSFSKRDVRGILEGGELDPRDPEVVV